MTEITIETSLNWHAQAVKEDDGLRLTFPIAMHTELQKHFTNPSLKTVQCWWRITRRIKYSEELAAGAQVRLTGYVETVGRQGRQVFHVKVLDVLTPKARKKAADLKKEQRCIARAVGMKVHEVFPSKKTKAITPQLSIFS